MTIEVKPGDKAVTRRLIHQINKRIPDLEAGKEYELEAILGAEYWADEDDSHLALGHCFSKLVGDGRTPFTLTGFTKNRHNNYLYMK